MLFPGPSGLVAAKYSHMKMFAASGNVGGDPSSWVTWTGSNNWADRSIKADEVTIRIPSKSVYNAYVDHWNFMRARAPRAPGRSTRSPAAAAASPTDRQVPVTIQAVPRGAVQQHDGPAAHEPDAERHPQPDQRRRPSPAPSRTAASASGANTASTHDPAPGQVAAVPGADQHAVEHEHHAGHRLEERGHQQHRHQQVAHGGVRR